MGRLGDRQEDKMIRCGNCGAVFPEGGTSCPYCGYIVTEGAERHFMEQLEETRVRLDHVDEEARADYVKEFRNTGNRILKRLLIVLLIIGILAAISAAAGHVLFSRRDGDYTDEMVWQHEHFDEMDQLFEEGKYETLRTLLNEYGGEGHDVWEWEHYDEVYEYTGG